MSGASDSWKPAHNPWLIAIAVTLAAFMEVLDTTIVNVALPYIAGSLAASNDEATYTLTAYLVANGIVLTIAGWLSDTIGRKRYFLICIGMFTLASFLCGLSQSLGQIIVFRLMQGFFGGGLQPSQQAIILDTFPPARRGAAFGVTAVATVVAPVLGPTLGGYLVEHSTWRWIFFINVPVGIFTLFVNAFLVQDPPGEKKKRARGLDYVGLALIVVGIGCMQIMIDRGEVNAWFSSPFIRIMAVIAFLGIFGAICWLLIADEPVVDLTVFKDRNFAVGCLLIGAVGALLYAGSVLIPQFAQQVLGYTALDSGFILSPGGRRRHRADPHRRHRDEGRPDPLRHHVRVRLHGLRDVLLELDCPGHRLPDVGSDAHAADGGARLPVRADLYRRLPDPARPLPQRCVGTFLDVPQRVRLDRDLALHRRGHGADASRPGPALGVHDAAAPGLQPADPGERAHAALAGAGGRPSAPAGRGAHLSDLHQAGPSARL